MLIFLFRNNRDKNYIFFFSFFLNENVRNRIVYWKVSRECIMFFYSYFGLFRSLV